MRPILLTFIAIALLVLSTPLGSRAKTLQEDSILKIVTAIKSWFETESGSTFRIEVINRHNGTYTIMSDIKKAGDSIEIKSHIKDMMDGERDTVAWLSTEAFKDRLKDASSVDDMLKIAGHFQTIKIKNGKDELVFGTTEGRGLMNFLELRDK